MGNVLGFLISTTIALVALSLALRPSETQSAISNNTKARHTVEEALEQAEKYVKEARELAEQMRQQVDQDRKQARARQEEANQTAAQAAWEAEQMRAQMEDAVNIANQAAAQAAREAERMKARMEEAVNAANRAQERSEAAANVAREEVVKFVQEAQEECERFPRKREEARRAQQAADEQHLGAEARKALIEKLPRVASKGTQKAMEAEEAERRLEVEIRHATPEELAATKRRMTRENAGKEIVAMNEEAGRVHQVADGQHREAEAGKALVDSKLPRIAPKEIQKMMRGQGSRKVPEGEDIARS